MKKTTVLFILIAATSFLFGFACKSALPETKPTTMKRVTGIGGVFFKTKDPKKTMEWYHTHLGLETSTYGVTFEWYDAPDSTRKASTQWNPFPETTKYFGPSGQDFMINYRVENLEALVAELKKEGVTIVDQMETYDYGKFIHIVDGDGNRVQLWQPM